MTDEQTKQLADLTRRVERIEDHQMGKLTHSQMCSRIDAERAAKKARYTTAMIVVQEFTDSVRFGVQCGDQCWTGERWRSGSLSAYSHTDASIIAAHLRANAILPGGA